MDGRGQEQGKEMPSSLAYNPPNKESPSKQHSPPSTVPTLRDSRGLLDHLHHQQHHGIAVLGQSSKPRMESAEPHLDPLPVASAPPASGSLASFRSLGALHQENPLQPLAQSVSSAVVPLTGVVRYKECMRNHAASMGSHIIDGCGEFMPGGEEGSPDFFKCAACECHRNFHRKETDGGEWQPCGSSSHFYGIAARSNGYHRATVSPPPTQYPHQTIFQPTPINVHQHQRFSFGISTSPVQASGQPVMMSFGGGGLEESSSEDLAIFQAHDLGPQSGQATTSRKRFRTKFTQQQKHKMVEFAEKLGWRMQKQDGQEVTQFCNEIGVKRQVFKVWMHNNKQALKKQQM